MLLEWTTQGKQKREALYESLYAIAQLEENDPHIADVVYDCMIKPCWGNIKRDTMPNTWQLANNELKRIRASVNDDDDHLAFLEAELLLEGLDPHSIDIEIALAIEHILTGNGKITYPLMQKKLKEDAHRKRIEHLERVRIGGYTDEGLLSLDDSYESMVSPELWQKRREAMERLNV